MNIYEITYYSYSNECYCPEFSRIIKSDKEYDEMDSLVYHWNYMLQVKDIEGRVSFRDLDIESEYTLNDLINDIEEM